MDAQTVFVRARALIWSMQAIDAQVTAAEERLQSAGPFEKAALLQTISDIDEQRLAIYDHYLDCCQAFQTAVERLRHESLD
jgi:hypothetical protein